MNTAHKIFKLINDKKILYFLFFLSIGGVFVELLSIAAIIPLVIFLLEENPIEKFEILKPIFLFFNLNNKVDIVNFGIIFILLVYLIRFFYLTFLNFYKNFFSFKLSIDIKNNLLSLYLSQNYSYFTNQNTSRLVKNMIVETSQFTGNAISSLINIFIDFIVIFLVMISLLFYQFKITIIISLFLITVGIVINSFSRNNIQTWGKERFKFDQELMKYLLEVFNLIREIKIFDKKKIFISSFINKYKPLGFLSVKQQTFYTFIKQSYEYVIIITFCSVVFYLTSIKISHEEIVKIIGIYALVAFRLLPLFTRILLSNQELKFFLPSVNHIYDEFKELRENIRSQNSINEKGKKEIKKNLNIQGVEFFYHKEKQILSDINLNINKNDKIGIFGKSGAGKSTLVDILFGLIKPKKGKIFIDNNEVNNFDKILEYQLGYVSQKTFLMDDTLRRNIAFGIDDKKIDDELVLQCLKESQMIDWYNSQENQLNTIIGENGKKLSGGERQRIGLARTLYLNNNFIILDEPTSSLDDKTTDEILKALMLLKNTTLIIISHQKRVLSICNKVYELKNGKLYEEKN